MLNPQVISKPSPELGQPRHSYKKENLLVQFSFGVKYGEMYPLRERTIDLAWFAVCKIKGPFAGRRIRLTDTTTLSTFLLKSKWGFYRAAESFLKELAPFDRTCNPGLTFAWGEKHHGVLPAFSQTSSPPLVFHIKELLYQVLPIGTRDTQRSLHPVISPLFPAPTALHRAQYQFPGPF